MTSVLRSDYGGITHFVRRLKGGLLGAPERSLDSGVVLDDVG
jgi:hypothetical protein